MEVDDEASAPESSSSDTSLTSLITIYQYPPPCPLLYSSKYYNHSCFQFLDSSLDGSVQIGKPPFQLQFLTDHERRNRLICLHVAALSRKPNEKISHSFPSVPVMTTDGIQGLKYPFFPLIHYSNLVAIKSFLHIPMPYYFTYTTIIMRNDVSQGLLHTLLRHPEQWWDHIYDLRALLKKPPNFNQKKPTKPSKKKPTKLNSKIWAVTDKNYEYDLFDFEDDMRTFSNKYYLRLSKMQMLIYEYLISHISSGTYEGEGCSNDGRMSILFAVYNDKMRIGLTDRIFGANGRVGDEYQRRIRLIKTAYFNKVLKPVIKLQNPRNFGFKP